MAIAQPLRLGVACAGDPADPAQYSGSPAAILAALRATGADAIPLRGDLGPGGQVWFERGLVAAGLRPWHAGDLRAHRRRLRHQSLMHPSMPVARTLAVHARLARAGEFDGVVQYGSDFGLPPRVPFVTIEDSTFLQSTRAYDWHWLEAATPERIKRAAAGASRRYARARACTFMSHWAARSALTDHGLPPGKVHVVGVGRNHEPPCPDRDWSVPRALFVGGDWERKNGDAVLRAFARLREALPDARLDVVGGHPPLDLPGVTGHGVLSLADPAGRRQVEELFGLATVFVMPSRHEPAGIVYAEAQAAGIASIGTTEGGAATVIGDAGMVVPPGDDDALTAALRRLAHPEEAARLGALARERAPLFTWLAVAERLIRALAPPGVDLEELAPFLPAEG